MSRRRTTWILYHYGANARRGHYFSTAQKRLARPVDNALITICYCRRINHSSARACVKNNATEMYNNAHLYSAATVYYSRAHAFFFYLSLTVIWSLCVLSVVPVIFDRADLGATVIRYGLLDAGLVSHNGS